MTRLGEFTGCYSASQETDHVEKSPSPGKVDVSFFFFFLLKQNKSSNNVSNPSGMLSFCLSTLLLPRKLRGARFSGRDPGQRDGGYPAPARSFITSF